MGRQILLPVPQPQVLRWYLSFYSVTRYTEVCCVTYHDTHFIIAVHHDATALLWSNKHKTLGIKYDVTKTFFFELLQIRINTATQRLILQPHSLSYGCLVAAPTLAIEFPCSPKAFIGFLLQCRAELFHPLVALSCCTSCWMISACFPVSCYPYDSAEPVAVNKVAVSDPVISRAILPLRPWTEPLTQCWRDWLPQLSQLYPR